MGIFGNSITEMKAQNCEYLHNIDSIINNKMKASGHDGLVITVNRIRRGK